MNQARSKLIVGYYGENFGDLLMLKSILERIIGAGSDARVFTYGNREKLREFLDREFPFASIDIVPAGLAAFAKACRKCDLAFWGGGTCFMDEGGTGGVKYLLVARMLGLRVAYLGIGVDSQRHWKTRLCLRLATIIARDIYLRDPISLAAIQALRPKGGARLSLVPDMAAGIEPEIVPVDARSGVLVCLRDLTRYFPAALASEINTGLCRLAVAEARRRGQGELVTILVADGEVDSCVSERAKEHLENSGTLGAVVSGNNVASAIAVIARSRCVISSRLHVGVVAHIVGVPYVLFNYSNKNRKFCQHVQEPWRAWGRDELANGDIDMSIPNADLIRASAARIDHVFKELLDHAA